MARVVVVHWKPDEIREHVARLRRAGYAVEVFSDQGGVKLRRFRDKPPDAFVVDLSRLPSHGRAVGVFLRQQKPTRHVPLVFVGGVVEKVERTWKELPDAVYTEWRRIRGALSGALKRPPDRPHVPDTMAGYSGTPLPKKLGIKPGSVVILLGATKGFKDLLRLLPEGVRLGTQTRRSANVIVLFTKSRAELQRRLPVAKQAMADGAALWLAWPKRASGMTTDLTQQSVRNLGLSSGLVDYKICAMDRTWSGLCFAAHKARKRRQ